MPASSVAMTPMPVRMKNLRSARGVKALPRSTRRRKPSPPTTSASARKYSQRTTSSLRVGPDEPNASVGGGAFARTPKVKTPETT